MSQRVRTRKDRKRKRSGFGGVPETQEKCGCVIHCFTIHIHLMHLLVQLFADRLQGCAVPGSPFAPQITILEAMGSACCSSDESDDDSTDSVQPRAPPHLSLKKRTKTKNCSFWRISPVWRGTAPSSLMYRIDEHVEEVKSLGILRKPRGNLSRNRLHSNKINSHVAAPAGLPRNCYNPVWYNSLPLVAKLRLDVKDWDWDFCHGGKLKVTAEDNPMGTTDGYDIPLGMPNVPDSSGEQRDANETNMFP